MPALEPFPIIPLTDDMILQDEPMGSKDKFWCQLPDCGSTPTGFDPFPTPRDPPLIEPRWGSMELVGGSSHRVRPMRATLCFVM